VKMPQNSKKASAKRPSFLGVYQAARAKLAGYLESRPHRSFRRTRRRDYIRPVELPGYVAFTNETHKTVWRYRRLLVPLLVVYLVLYAVLVGISSQETYSTVSEAIKELGNEIYDGSFSALGQASLLFFTVGTSGITGALTEVQQVFSVLLLLMLWLSVVWLLRNKMAGHNVRMRDGLYSSGSPLFASIVIALVFAIQLLPVGIAAIGYSAANSSGLLAGGVEAMLFWIAAGLLTILSLYWITSSLFAMIIVTLPGMYPWRALQSSGKIVMGRRTILLLRTLWMLLVVALAWVLILIPFILLDIWLKSMWVQIDWLPIVPVVVMILSAVTAVWVFTYVYLLYRKVVDHDTE